MVQMSPRARLEFLRRCASLENYNRSELYGIYRPVPAHLERLRLFCILYDHLYEKIEKEVRYRLEQTLIGKVHSRIEHHLVRKVNSEGTIAKAF